MNGRHARPKATKVITTHLFGGLCAFSVTGKTGHHLDQYVWLGSPEHRAIQRWMAARPALKRVRPQVVQQTLTYST